MLQQNAASILRRVQRGESLEVTARGRPIARLVPTKATDIIALLEASGSLRRAREDVLALGAPLTIPRGKETGSRRLARMRAHER
jgi:prevent-host-death family protein